MAEGNSEDPAGVALWRRVAGTARPLKRAVRDASAAHRRREQERQAPAKEAPETEAPETEAPMAAKAPRARKVKESSKRELTPAPESAEQAPHSGLSAREMHKLGRGRYRPEERLDLHGLPAAAAEREVYRFLCRSVDMNLRTVLVITGKGRNGEGILRQNFPDWMAKPHNASLVVAYTGAHGADGGGGAFYVRLRRRERVRGPRPSLD